MAVTPLGITIDESDLHSEKVFWRIAWTRSGSSMNASEEQFSKACSPIVLTEEGIEIDAREVHP